LHLHFPLLHSAKGLTTLLSLTASPRVQPPHPPFPSTKLLSATWTTQIDHTHQVLPSIWRVGTGWRVYKAKNSCQFPPLISLTHHLVHLSPVLYIIYPNLYFEHQRCTSFHPLTLSSRLLVVLRFVLHLYWPARLQLLPSA
jgi:hypothetical protein